ncbi:E3 SUMO-protein ligase RanBP2 [Chamberlinius hualienensis]
MSDQKEVEQVEPSSPDVHFEPIIILPEVEVKSFEEDEDVLLQLRARLYRFCAATDDSPGEWKERGTGDVKILKHKDKETIRLLMRRDKTLKICANHYITPWMELKPNCGSDKAWVWSVSADYADEEPKEEMLAIKFGNAENARKFKEVFDECKLTSAKEGDDDDEESSDESEDEDDEVTAKLNELNVKDDKQEKATKSEDDVKETSAVVTTEKSDDWHK